ncbi:hypothetical protein Bca4012_079231 [Brassica carinata]
MYGMNMKIDKFTGRNNFSLWQIKMKALLKQQGLWAPLSGKKVEPVTTEMKVTEEKAYSTILLCMPTSARVFRDTTIYILRLL